MNNKHKLFLIFSLGIIFLVLWYPKSKHISIKPRHKYIENMANQGEACCNNNPLFLAMKNSADISVLKTQVKELLQLKETVRSLETDNQNNTKYLNNLQQEDVDVAKNIQDQMEADEEEDNEENSPGMISNTIIGSSNESNDESFID